MITIAEDDLRVRFIRFVSEHCPRVKDSVRVMGRQVSRTYFDLHHFVYAVDEIICLNEYDGHDWDYRWGSSLTVEQIAELNLVLPAIPV